MSVKVSAKLAVAGALSALAVGVVSVVGVTAAADEPSTPAAAPAPAVQEQDADQPSYGGPEAFGDHGEAMEHLGQLREAFAALPADLRRDLRQASTDGDIGERLTALADVHDRAASGEYGAEVRSQVDDLDAQLPTQADLEQLMADHLGALPFEIPTALQDDLAEAAGNGDAGDRLVALADVHDRAVAGDYGAQVQQMVEGLGRMLEQYGGAGGGAMLGGLGA